MTMVTSKSNHCPKFELRDDQRTKVKRRLTNHTNNNKATTVTTTKLWFALVTRYKIIWKSIILLAIHIVLWIPSDILYILTMNKEWTTHHGKQISSVACMVGVCPKASFVLLYKLKALCQRVRTSNEVNTKTMNTWPIILRIHSSDGLQLLIGWYQQQHSKHGDALRPVTGLLKGFNTIPSTIFRP